MTVFPDDEYQSIEHIEIHFSNGRRAILDGEESVQWARAVDWGLRRFQLEQFDKYKQIVKTFEWKEF
jgi:hypothetical protein